MRHGMPCRWIATARTEQLAEVRDAMDSLEAMDAGAKTAAHHTPGAPAPMAQAEIVPQIRGMGFAQVAGQPGKTTNEKRLMAMRAARMDALRDLTEQVHGIRLSADTSIRDAVVVDDRLSAMVQGTLRGARTLRITPTGPDSYEVEMAIDRDTLVYLVRSLKGHM